MVVPPVHEQHGAAVKGVALHLHSDAVRALVACGLQAGTSCGRDQRPCCGVGFICTCTACGQTAASCVQACKTCAPRDGFMQCNRRFPRHKPGHLCPAAPCRCHLSNCTSPEWHPPGLKGLSYSTSLRLCPVASTTRLPATWPPPSSATVERPSPCDTSLACGQAGSGCRCACCRALLPWPTHAGPHVAARERSKAYHRLHPCQQDTLAGDWPAVPGRVSSHDPRPAPCRGRMRRPTPRSAPAGGA